MADDGGRNPLKQELMDSSGKRINQQTDQNSLLSVSYVPSEHEEMIVKQFGKHRCWCDTDITERTSDTRNVFICFSNRCGSNFLAAALASSGRIPLAGEIFNQEFVLRFSREREITSLPEYLTAIHHELSRHDVFCAKVGFRQLMFLWRIGAFENVFSNPRFIHMTRHDLLGQAISFSIAEQTKQWTSEQDACVDEVQFSASDIESRIRGISAENQRFAQFFAIMGLQSIPVVYEDLQADPENVIRCLGKKLDITGELKADPNRIRIKKQRNVRNDQFRQRFLEDYPRAVIVAQNQVSQVMHEQGIWERIRFWRRARNRQIDKYMQCPQNSEPKA